MIKNFLSKFGRQIKTRRRSALDCSDFEEAVPVAPTSAHIRDVVEKRLFQGKGPAGSEAEAQQRDHAIRATAFDLQYRCGAGGRCVGSCADGKTMPGCRFPRCFTLRPITKGAEIAAERTAYEIPGADDADIALLIDLARSDKLDECEQGIQRLVDTKLHQAAGGRPLAGIFNPNDKDFSATAPKFGESSAFHGVNPLIENEKLREEVIALYLWRASLLVNLRRDEQAVNSLLNLSFLLEKEHRLRAVVAAAGWATLNDMELIYYRSFVQLYDEIPIAKSFAYDRPTLLRRVFEACKSDNFISQHAAHMAFSKEVTAVVSRAQAAQMHQDATEDPMSTYCIPLALQYYRFMVSDEFWAHFFNLLVMPPVPPPTDDERNADPMRDLHLTPPHVLDAVGRSIMLHHLLLLHDGREKERDSGKLSEYAELGENTTREQRAMFHSILDPRSAAMAQGRLRELLSTIKQNDAAALAGQQAGRQIPTTAAGTPPGDQSPTK